MNTLYTVLFVLSFVMMAVLIALFRDRISIYYTLMFAGALISNLGYMQLSDVTNLQAALFANQTVYLGASFTPFFLLMCIADLCKIEIKKFIQFAFLAYGTVIFILTSTVGTFDGYYKSVEIVTENGVSYLLKEYGSFHFLYPVYVVIVALISLGMILYSIRRKRDVSYTISVSLFFVDITVVGVYIIEKQLGLTTELVPIAYVIAEAWVLLLLRSISLYDVTFMSTDFMVESMDYGFVLSDSKGRYLGGDVAAKNWFPEIKNLHIDVVPTCEKTPFLAQLSSWSLGEDEREKVYFNCGENIVEANHSILKKRFAREIHCVYLRDDTKQQKYTKLVEEYNVNLEKAVDEKTEKIRNIQDDIIISMASIVENRDSNTGGHIQRTSDVVHVFVGYLQKNKQFMNLTDGVARSIIKAAPLHDFGKIGIKDEILNKPGKFEPEEYEEMKKHSAKGAVIVDRILQNSNDPEFKRIAVNVAHFHHERWDGKGYPTGIEGHEIPFEARVMALADVFDALVSKRVYKERFSYDKAFSIIEEGCGTQFDPILCKEFLKHREDFEKLYDSYVD